MRKVIDISFVCEVTVNRIVNYGEVCFVDYEYRIIFPVRRPESLFFLSFFISRYIYAFPLTEHVFKIIFYFFSVVVGFCSYNGDASLGREGLVSLHKK